MMIWIVSLALVASALIVTRSIDRPSIAVPTLAMLALAAGLTAFTETGPSSGLRPSLDAPRFYSATEVKADRTGHYFTKAEIDGTTIMVMVDTGASGVALSYEDAVKVGIRPVRLDFDVPVSTANGLVKAARVKLRRVEVDNVRVNDVDGWVLPEGAMQISLLGMSFLGRLSSFKVEDGVLYLKD